MTNWLAPLEAALDTPGPNVEIFIRDDDAGWGDPLLFRLLDAFEAFGLPADVAAIPTALSRESSRELRRRIERPAPLVAVHQHGTSHANHETNGRACEFGPSRARDAQRSDIRDGRARLQDHLSHGLQPIFTPPWNRCTRTTVEILKEEGFAVLSRDATAIPFSEERLTEVPVTVDWFKRYPTATASREEVGRRLAAGVTTARPIGLMLHHAAMDEGDFAAVAALAHLIARSARATPRFLHDLAATASGPRIVEEVET